jgi:hypothetical protein
MAGKLDSNTHAVVGARVWRSCQTQRRVLAHLDEIIRGSAFKGSHRSEDFSDTLWNRLSTAIQRSSRAQYRGVALFGRLVGQVTLARKRSGAHPLERTKSGDRTKPFAAGGFVTAMGLLQGVGPFTILDESLSDRMRFGWILLSHKSVEHFGFEAAHAALGPFGGGDDFVEDKILLGTDGLELLVIIGGSSSRAASSSPGMIEDLAEAACFRALKQEAALPSVERGPVDFCAFRRLASTWAGVAIARG